MKLNRSIDRAINLRSKSRERGPSRERGYLMLDLIIVMTLTAVILSTTSVWMYKTIRYATNVSQRDSHARNISRISRQLRSDARDATTIDVEANTLKISTQSNASIEYQIEANKIHRHMTGGDKDHHDDFLFADNANLVWSSADSSESATLEISRDFSSMSASKTKSPKGFDARVVVRTARETSK